MYIQLQSVTNTLQEVNRFGDQSDHEFDPNYDLNVDHLPEILLPLRDFSD